MPASITVERLSRDGPFRVGDEYRDERIRGQITRVVPTGPNHVNVTVALTEDP